VQRAESSMPSIRRFCLVFNTFEHGRIGVHVVDGYACSDNGRRVIIVMRFRRLYGLDRTGDRGPLLSDRPCQWLLRLIAVCFGGRVRQRRGWRMWSFRDISGNDFLRKRAMNRKRRKNKRRYFRNTRLCTAENLHAASGDGKTMKLVPEHEYTNAFDFNSLHG